MAQVSNELEGLTQSYDSAPLMPRGNSKRGTKGKDARNERRDTDHGIARCSVAADWIEAAIQQGIHEHLQTSVSTAVQQSIQKLLQNTLPETDGPDPKGKRKITDDPNYKEPESRSQEQVFQAPCKLGGSAKSPRRESKDYGQHIPKHVISRMPERVVGGSCPPEPKGEGEKGERRVG